MSVITLLSDWGHADQYVAALKGTILSLVPDATIVDISHEIKRDDILHGSFVLKNTWQTFPKGTIHICGLTGSSTPPALIAIKYEDHFFIGSDDGLFMLVFREMPPESYFVKSSKGEKVMTGTRTLAGTAAFLAKTGKIEEVGDLITNHKQSTQTEVVMEDHAIKGIVIHVDHFGNLITNVSREFFNKAANGRRYEIHLRKQQYMLQKIGKHYYDNTEGEIVAYFNDAGLLEIAINKGSAAQLVGMKYRDVVTIEFK